MIDRSKKLPAFFYQTSGGNEPVREWILELSPEDRKIIGRDIQKVEFGWPIGMPYCRSLGEGLWEVRSDLTDGKDRASDFLCRGRSHGVAARFHQEDAEDAGARFAGRAETYEGVC